MPLHLLRGSKKRHCTGIIAANARHPRPPAGALRQPHSLKPLHLPAPHQRAPWSRPYARMRRARAGFEHAARCAKSMPRPPPGRTNGNAAQTGGLARQVRQRMNRLGKPEHRARFCFFSKKKSLAGMRRFRIPSKIQIRMGFIRSAQYDFEQAALRPFEVFRVLPLACAPRQQKPQSKNTLRGSSVLACMPSKRKQLKGFAPLNTPCTEAKKRHHIRKNHCRTTPAICTRQPALCANHTLPSRCICCPHPLKPLRLARSIAPGGCLQRNARSRASTLPLVACPYGGRISAKTARRFSVRCINATVSPG